jgi:SAM-dependent methyltransferase
MAEEGASTRGISDKVEPMGKDKTTTMDVFEDDEANNTVTQIVEEKEGGYSYFAGYSDFEVHYNMLRDKVRTQTYRDAIVHNKHLFTDRVVLDIGCGTGILSMFAAQAGASHVIGIDNSDIAIYARQIINDNGFGNIVTIVQANVEDLTELPYGVEKVDIIVSEWMGYCLLTESMLHTVLHARDKWLAPGGKLFPDKASLYITAIEDKLHKSIDIDWFKNVYGFDMSLISKYKLSRSHIGQISESQVVTDNCLLMELNLLKLPNTKDNFAFTRNFHLTCRRNDYISGFATFFVVEFMACKKKTWLSTAPEAASTHWHQSIFYFDEFTAAKQGDVITGTFTVRPIEGSRRNLDVTINTEIYGQETTYHHEARTYRGIYY